MTDQAWGVRLAPGSRSPRLSVTSSGSVLLCTLLILAWLVPGAAHAGSAPLSYLGALTSDMPEDGSGLFWFQRIGGPERGQGKVQLSVFETGWDEGSAVNRWAYIKALDQFGSWSGLRPETIRVAIPCLQRCTTISAATFNWTHARYRSRYVVLSDHVMQSRVNGPLARLSPQDGQLFERASRARPVSYDTGARVRWPVVAVGGYASHGGYVFPPDVDWIGPGARSLTFADLHRAYRQGQRSLYSFVDQFNAYVNVMVALI